MTQLLSTIVSEKTGYTEEEAKQILLNKMDKDTIGYKSALKANAVDPLSWAAITLCYETSNPAIYIKAVGKKKG